jgi:hypothetical protein
MSGQSRVRVVEGFASTPTGGVPIHHACLTLDGIHAIDVTLKNAPDCYFFGIPFSREVLQRWISRRRKWTLLDASDPDQEIEELLQDAVREPSIFP